MKAEFYYKEEFPLELRITIEDINELRYLYSLHGVRSDIVRERFKWINQLEGDKDKRISEFEEWLVDKVKQNGNDPDADIYKIISNVTEDQEEKEDERRDSLQGEVS